jgi:hypothetical protein
MKTIIDINKLFESPLTEQEMRILQLRFGLGVVRELPPHSQSIQHKGIPIGSNGHSLNEIGHIFGFTRSRASQIQDRALRKIRHPSQLRILLNFLNETPLSEDAVLLVRNIFPDKARLLNFGSVLQSMDDAQAGFAKQVIELCYGSKTAEPLGDGPSPAGSPHRKRSPDQKNLV